MENIRNVLQEINNRQRTLGRGRGRGRGRGASPRAPATPSTSASPMVKKQVREVVLLNKEEVTKTSVPRNTLSLKLQKRLKKVKLLPTDTAATVKEKILKKFNKRYLLVLTWNTVC